SAKSCTSDGPKSFSCASTACCRGRWTRRCAGSFRSSSILPATTIEGTPMKILQAFVASLMTFASISAAALDDASRTRLEHIQSRWALIHYDLPGEQREEAFAQLAEDAGDAVAAEPQAAELRIWHGIVLSTWA